ncbi:MAG: hypothetical protein AUG91_04995 [Actinobacteria bacterium 13_1_20CM_4_69_9]|nr:MAG: hypothetical protein AUG91_04995 [Actinobacteria bacterium 13_1_20CM_4_69_9]
MFGAVRSRLAFDVDAATHFRVEGALLRAPSMFPRALRRIDSFDLVMRANRLRIPESPFA